MNNIHKILSLIQRKILPVRYQHDLYEFLIRIEIHLWLSNIDQDFPVKQNLQQFLYMNVDFLPIKYDFES
jgi:hypothetical protein